MKSKQMTLPRILMTCLLISGNVSMAGCGSTRVQFINSQEKNDIFRVGPGVKGKAYAWDGQAWVLSKNKIEYPEGAYVGFLQEDQEGETPE